VELATVGVELAWEATVEYLLRVCLVLSALDRYVTITRPEIKQT
jgi:hypothetical protein